jgi:hypothetical protein
MGGPTNTMEEDLLSRYADYEDMDEQAELNTALDLISDDSTQMDTITNEIVHIHSEDKKVQSILEECFRKNLRIDEEIWEMTRTTCKYGNAFQEHVINETDGLISHIHLPPPQMRRIDDEDGSLLGFIFDRGGQFAMSGDEFFKRLNDRKLNEQEYLKGFRNNNVYEDWEVTHFRLRSKHPGAQYGWSFLEGARWVNKRLQLLEDAALLYKLQRAPQRYVFNVDVGDLPPNEALRYVDAVRAKIKKQKYVNPNTGKIDLTSNVITDTEDFFIPSRKDKPAMNVETVGGFDSAFYMEDVQYFKDKLYSAIKIPKDYLNYSEDSVSKANLATEDSRMARTVLRVQRAMNTGLDNMARVHLAALGHDPEMLDFNIYLTPPGGVFEKMMMEVRTAQLEIAEKYRAFVDDYWIMSNILKFSDEDISAIQERIKKQKAQENPFGETRFPTLESKRVMHTEVKKILEDFGLEALLRDHKLGPKLKDLAEHAEDFKYLLKKR